MTKLVKEPLTNEAALKETKAYLWKMCNKHGFKSIYDLFIWVEEGDGWGDDHGDILMAYGRMNYLENEINKENK